MSRRFLPALILPLVLLALCATNSAQKSKASDPLQPLATSLAAYLEARASGDGLDASRAAVAQRMEELGKALRADPLKRPAELGRALGLARAGSRAGERGGKVESAVFTGGSFTGAGLGYAYRLPREYDVTSAYPLILTIPAEDEVPAEHLRTHWTQADVLERCILVAPEMPEQQESWARVTVKGRPGGLCHVLTALRIAGERFAVDFDRVYVAGRAKGVPAALAAGNHSPQRFAGVIGRAGDAGELKPDNFANLPTFFAGGGPGARAFVEALEEAGYGNGTFSADATEDDLWRWILDHPRKPWPERVVLVPGDPYPLRAHWLQVNPSDPNCRANAIVDRSANTIRIEAQGIAQATLFLSDALVDLARPVRVLCNGTEHTAVVAPRLSSFLELADDGTSDPGAVYTARVDIDLTRDPSTAESNAPTENQVEFAKRLTSAGSDVGKLWELHPWCQTTQLVPEDARVLRTIVRLQPEHAEARAALGNVRSGERWFSSSDALARFQASQQADTAAALGLIQFQTLWMHRDERALAVKGWKKDPETGLWTTPADEKRIAQGWMRQDLDWIAPEEAPRVDENLWKVEGEWLDLAHADRRHASIDSMWRIPDAEILLHSTAEREVSLRAQRVMARALVDLRRVFGAEPVLPLSVALLRDEEQYDRFAFGEPDGRRLARHAGRLQVVHSAYFAESWLPRIDGKPKFQGMGVCVWDAHVPNGDAYGLHAARLATGLSYVEALDPSPNAVKKALAAGAAGPGPGYYAAYQAEKVMPEWLRWGGAVYAERYFEDTTVGADGDRWWARQWSIDNLKSRGGLAPLSTIFAFALDPDDREASLKLLIEAGLVVAFVVDGNCAALAEPHAAFRKALASGKLEARHVTALTEALLAHEAELRAFGGF